MNSLFAHIMHFSLIVTYGLLTGVIAAPAPQKRHVVHERRDQAPRNWRRENPLHPDSSLPMRFAITQNNLHNAEAYLMDVSDPSSPNFGNHWSAKKVAETFAPSAESLRAVTKWLAEYGIKSDRVKQSQSLNWIHANVTVAEAESLLNTKYYVSPTKSLICFYQCSTLYVDTRHNSLRPPTALVFISPKYYSVDNH